MKTVMTGLILLLALSMAQADEAVYALQVDGLGCPFCAFGIEKQLSAIDGVDNVVVDINKGIVIVIMQQNTSLDAKQARQAVTDAGFTLRSFSQRSEGNPDASSK